MVGKWGSPERRRSCSICMRRRYRFKFELEKDKLAGRIPIEDQSEGSAVQLHY